MPGASQCGQDCVLVAEDAGLQDLQAMLANFVPVAGEGNVQGRDLDRDQAREISQAAMVGDDRGEKFCQRKQAAE